jgi:hypothetical protein
VPPPPVTGAEFGYGVLADGFGDGPELALGEALGLALTEVPGVTEVLGVTVVVVTSFGEMETLAETDTLTEALTLAPALGENTLAVDVEVPDVQAETARQANAASRPPPTALRRTRCAIHDALAVRALIGPPHVPAKTSISRPGARETGPGGKRMTGHCWHGGPNNCRGENRRA